MTTLDNVQITQGSGGSTIIDIYEDDYRLPDDIEDDNSERLPDDNNDKERFKEAEEKLKEQDKETSKENTDNKEDYQEEKDDKDHTDDDLDKTFESHREEFKELDKLGNDLSEKGFDMDQAIQDFEKNGEISKNTYDAMSKLGYPKPVVDAIVDKITNTIRNTNDSTEKLLRNIAGSYEGGKDLFEYINKGMSQNEANAFKDALSRGDNITMGIIAEKAKDQMVRSRGVSGKNTTSGSGVVGNETRPKTVEGFKTVEELKKVMNSHEYLDGGAYSKQMRLKVAATDPSIIKQLGHF